MTMIPGELHEPEFELLLGCHTCTMHSVAYKNVSKQTKQYGTASPANVL